MDSDAVQRSIRQAGKELREYQEGKRQSRPIDELMDELEARDTMLKNTALHQKVDNVRLKKALEHLSKIVKTDDELAKMQQEPTEQHKARRSQ